MKAVRRVTECGWKELWGNVLQNVFLTSSLMTKLCNIVHLG